MGLFRKSTASRLSAVSDMKCYLCTHVVDGQRPVLLVTRPDGDWCLTCGDEHVQEAASFRVAHLAHPLANDSSLQAVLDLRKNEEAERLHVGGAWTRSVMPPDVR